MKGILTSRHDEGVPTHPESSHPERGDDETREDQIDEGKTVVFSGWI
jgi:hypothetical protein